MKNVDRAIYRKLGCRFSPLRGAVARAARSPLTCHQCDLLRQQRPVAARCGFIAANRLQNAHKTDIGRTGFERCLLANSCIAKVIMDENLIKQLRSGQTATFIVFQTCPFRKSYPDVLVMQPGQNRNSGEITKPLDGPL